MSKFEQLSGKVAVVTGGASGIGKGMARRFIAQGMRVVIADVERAVLEKTAAEIGATPVLADVSSRESVQALADEVLRRFGAVDVVCNNAGVGSMARIADMKTSDWTWFLNVNLMGVVHGVEVFLPILSRNEGGGHIVNTASVGGFSTLPGLGGYCATKFAVVGLSETLAQELAESGSRVGVTILCPGPVHTNIKASTRNRPASLAQGGLVDTDLEATEVGASVRWLEPDQVGDIVVRAIRRGDLYAFTHPEMKAGVAARHRQIEAAFDADAAQPAANGPSSQDRTEIYELYARYSWALDTGDTDGYVALFTEDAEVTEETRTGELEVRKGHAEIRKLVLKFHDRPDFPGHQHQMSQFVFEPDPSGRPDHWVVRSYALATINHPPQPPHLHWCGHVRDVVAKVDGRWRLKAKDIMGWAGAVLSKFDSRRVR